jgi:hypothetical protein
MVLGGCVSLSEVLLYPTLRCNTRPDPNLPHVGMGDECVLLRHVRALPRGIRFSIRSLSKQLWASPENHLRSIKRFKRRPAALAGRVSELQEYLAHKKQPPRRTLQ